MTEGIRQRPDAPLAGAELALPYLLDDADFAAFARRAVSGAARARVSEPLLGALVAALWTSRAEAEPRGLAVLVGDDDAARALSESASAFLPGEAVAFMPSRGAAHGAGLDPPPHLAGERSRALHTLAAGGLVAVSADALVERLPPPAVRPRPVELRLGEDRPFDELTRELAGAGYERADTVEERGQFSVRGGLVDIFPSTGREPVRAEFFGDSLERLSAFSAFTQRSLRDLDHVLIYPAAEVATTGSGPVVAWGWRRTAGRWRRGSSRRFPRSSARPPSSPGIPRRSRRRSTRRPPRPPSCSTMRSRSGAGMSRRPRRARSSTTPRRSRRCRSASPRRSTPSPRRSRRSGSPRPRTSCAA